MAVLLKFVGGSSRKVRASGPIYVNGRDTIFRHHILNTVISLAPGVRTALKKCWTPRKKRAVAVDFDAEGELGQPDQ